jgi:hypothetical protein
MIGDYKRFELNNTQFTAYKIDAVPYLRRQQV